MMNATDLLAQLRKACEADGSQAAWAERAGLAAPYISDVLRGRREPGPSLCEALGFERVVLYRRKK